MQETSAMQLAFDHILPSHLTLTQYYHVLCMIVHWVHWPLTHDDSHASIASSQGSIDILSNVNHKTHTLHKETLISNCG